MDDPDAVIKSIGNYRHEKYIFEVIMMILVSTDVIERISKKSSLRRLPRTLILELGRFLRPHLEEFLIDQGTHNLTVITFNSLYPSIRRTFNGRNPTNVTVMDPPKRLSKRGMKYRYGAT